MATRIKRATVEAVMEKCREFHGSAREVRECYARRYADAHGALQAEAEEAARDRA